MSQSPLLHLISNCYPCHDDDPLVLMSIGRAAVVLSNLSFFLLQVRVSSQVGSEEHAFFDLNYSFLGVRDVLCFSCKLMTFLWSLGLLTCLFHIVFIQVRITEKLCEDSAGDDLRS